MDLSSGQLILIASALLIIGALYAVQMVRKNARELRSTELVRGSDMAKDESTAEAAVGAARRAVLDSDVAEELFGEMFAMRSAMSELVAEVRAMHETLSTMSIEHERERRVA